MHELGITQGIIDRAREAAQQHGARKVTDVYLVMTPAADFTQESIEMYFEMLTGEDPLFAGAALHVERRAATGRCLSCGDEFSTEALLPACAQCGSAQIRFDPEAPMIQVIEVGIDDGDEQA